MIVTSSLEGLRPSNAGLNGPDPPLPDPAHVASAIAALLILCEQVVGPSWPVSAAHD